MKIFSKRETILQNMTTMAFFAAINIIICLVSSYVPFLSIVIIFVLPLVSALVEIYCKDRYYIIYAVASLLLSMLVTFDNFQTALFYLFPALVSGYCFGLCVKKIIPSIYSIMLSSLIQVGLTYLSLPLIKLIYEVDMIDTFIAFFNVQETNNLSYIIPSFILTLSVAQNIFTYIIITIETARLKNKFTNTYSGLIANSLSFGAGLLSIIFAFFFPPLSYFFFFIATYFTAYVVYKIIDEKNVILIIFFIVTILSVIFVNALIYKMIEKSLSLLVINLINVCFSLIYFVFVLLKRQHKKINKELPSHFIESLPTDGVLKQIYEGKKVSYETIRKALIILQLYDFYEDVYEENERYIRDSLEDFYNETNALLMKCGLAHLYVRHPFDWIIIFCALSTEPVGVFKDLNSKRYV